MPITREFTYDDRDYNLTLSRNAQNDRTLTLYARPTGTSVWRLILQMVVDDNLVTVK